MMVHKERIYINKNEDLFLQHNKIEGLCEIVETDGLGKVTLYHDEINDLIEKLKKYKELVDG